MHNKASLATGATLYKTIIHELTHYAYRCPGSPPALPGFPTPIGPVAKWTALACLQREADEMLANLCEKNCPTISAFIGAAFAAYPTQCGQFDAFNRLALQQIYNKFVATNGALCPIPFDWGQAAASQFFVSTSGCCI